MLRMAQLNLKVLISASYNPSSLIPIRRVLPLLLFKPKTHHSLSFRPLSTVIAAGRRGYQRVDKFQEGGIPLRKKGTPEDTARKKKSSPAEKISSDMTEGEPKGFNMKRAEGLDKAGPKELKLKTRQINPVNTSCHVQILGTGMDTHDTSPSVLLFFDQQRFIFNAGEGLQRFCTEHKIKLSRIDHIFLTRVCSETAGGLPGLLLTMAGIGDDGMTVNIWGPSDLKYLIDAMRLFIPNAAVVHTHSFGPGYSKEKLIVQNSNESLLTNPITLVKDDIVKISAILLLPNAPERREAIDFSMGNTKNTEESVNAAQKRPRLGSERSSEIREGASGFWASYRPGDIAVVYICELPDIKGKFDPSKAAALGLKPGPKYRELQLGNSVMSDTMKLTVHPSDVMGPSSPGPIVLLVDCPTVSHLPHLLSAPAFHDFFGGAENGLESHHKFVNCVIHLSPATVTKCPEYEQWMSKFVGAQHIMAGHEVKNTEFPILKSSARLLTRLNFLCPQLFSVPGFRSLCLADTSEAASIQPSQVDSVMSKGSIPAENLLKFCLRPYARLGLDRSSIPSLPAASDILDELLSEIPEIVGASKVIAQLWNPVLIEHGENTELIDVQGTASIILEEPWLQDRRCKSNSEVEGTSNDDSLKETQLTVPAEVKDCNSSDEIPECLDGVSREEMEIVFLGTGSSQPSKYRNVSAIYINLFSQGGILLDCGEGTLGQLKRRFGVRGADDVIKGLKCIWISHIHADHHTGLARILSLREQLLKNESHEYLLVVGPRPLKKFLDAYSRVEDLGMQFLDCRQTVEASINAYEELNRSGDTQVGVENSNKDGSNHSGQAFKKDNLVGSNLVQFKSESRPDTSSFTKNQMQSYWQRPGFLDESILDIKGLEKLKRVISEAGLKTLTSVPVVHCPQAFGVVLQAACRNTNSNKTVPGWKLVYSGDTRPCKNLMDAAHGATVLIHEATFDDSMPEEAIARNHSLTKEAIEVGASAGAYRIILTHFSQRYPKIPVFDESYTDRTCIAFDMMSVNLADLPLVPKINPYLKLLFKNEMLADDAVENENVIQDATVE